MLISLATSLTFLPPCSLDITWLQSILLAAAYAFAEPSESPVATTKSRTAGIKNNFFVTVVPPGKKIRSTQRTIPKARL